MTVGDQLDPVLNANEHIRILQIQHNQQYMQQQLLLDPNAISASVADPNSAISELLHNMTRQEEAAIRSYLSNFGIVNNTPVIPVRNLSGGQKMKLALAVALYEKPDVIILDEVCCMFMCVYVDMLMTLCLMLFIADQSSGRRDGGSTR